MDENLLLCSIDPSLKDLAAQVSAELPTVQALEKNLPDILLLDMDLLSDAPADYLQAAADRYPSIRIFIIADPKYPEDVLFAGLRLGCRGWIFKDESSKVKENLKNLIESGHFLKPYVSQLLLQEFKSAKGEFLLAMEEEILRQSARGLPAFEIEKNLNLNDKSLKNHWDGILKKLVINNRAASQAEAPQQVHPSQEKSVEASSRSAAPSGAEPESLQVVTFFLGKEEFAIGLTDLQEIERVLTITPLPNVHPSILGVMNLRGKIVPVVDLRVKLGIPAGPLSKESRIMIVNLGEKLCGLAVDSVKEVLKIDETAVQPRPILPLNINEDVVTGVMNLDTRLILLLDLKKTMAANFGVK